MLNMSYVIVSMDFHVVNAHRVCLASWVSGTVVPIDTTNVGVNGGVVVCCCCNGSQGGEYCRFHVWLGFGLVLCLCCVCGAGQTDQKNCGHKLPVFPPLPPRPPKPPGQK